MELYYRAEELDDGRWAVVARDGHVVETWKTERDAQLRADWYNEVIPL